MTLPGSRRRRHRARALALVVGLTVLAAASAQAAAEDPEAAIYGDPEAGYWHLAILGGAAVPTARMADERKAGLAATFRLGWTSRVGLGLALSGLYSPLPSQISDPAVTIDNHLGVVSAGPRFTLGRRRLRLWAGGGGGAALERTSMGAGGDRSTETALEPVAVGEAGAELYLFEGGALTVTGSYVRSFGDDVGARLAAVLGGLVFTF